MSPSGEHEPFLADVVVESVREPDFAAVAAAVGQALAPAAETLLERAERIAAAVHGVDASLANVTVVLNRPEASLGVPIQAVEVTIERPGSGAAAGVIRGEAVAPAAIAAAAPPAAVPVASEFETGNDDDAAEPPAEQAAAGAQPVAAHAGALPVADPVPVTAPPRPPVPPTVVPPVVLAPVAPSRVQAREPADLDADAAAWIPEPESASVPVPAWPRVSAAAPSAPAWSPQAPRLPDDVAAEEEAFDLAEDPYDGHDAAAASAPAGPAAPAPAAPAAPAPAAEPAGEPDDELDAEIDDELDARLDTGHDDAAEADADLDVDAVNLAHLDVAPVEVAAIPVRRPSASAPLSGLLVISSTASDGKAQLAAVVGAAHAASGLTVTDVSPLARTATPGGSLFSAILAITTTLGPGELAATCLDLVAGRAADAEILALEGLVGEVDGVTLPLPGAHESAAVLAPWAQLQPSAVLPGLGGGPVAVLAQTAPDSGSVKWLALDWLE